MTSAICSHGCDERIRRQQRPRRNGRNFPRVLQRGRMNLFVGRRRFEPPQHGDVSTHRPTVGQTAFPRHEARAALNHLARFWAVGPGPLRRRFTPRWRTPMRDQRIPIEWDRLRT